MAEGQRNGLLLSREVDQSRLMEIKTDFTALGDNPIFLY